MDAGRASLLGVPHGQAPFVVEWGGATGRGAWCFGANSTLTFIGRQAASRLAFAFGVAVAGGFRLGWSMLGELNFLLEWRKKSDTLFRFKGELTLGETVPCFIRRTAKQGGGTLGEAGERD